MALPLFVRFPPLSRQLPHLDLGRLPTPVIHTPLLARHPGLDKLFIKHDGLSGQLYGGNKVRKLEFLLAKARSEHATAVMTFGCAGSNHALATTLYATRSGMESISMLLPQPNAHSVRRNLLAGLKAGARIHYYDSLAAMEADTDHQRQLCQERTGKPPFVIPPGGSSPLGAVGFVNAAFELQEQIERGELPEPSHIYVAGGTLGTAAGLMVGLRAAGLRCRVICVRVTDLRFASAEKLVELCNRVVALLRSSLPSLTIEPFTESDVHMNHDQLGPGYGHHTRQSAEAVAIALADEHIGLEGTYTGKALAALRADAPRLCRENATVLFWNTYNARDLSFLTDGADYHRLPHPLHRYFEEEVQPPDRHRRSPTG